MARKISTDAARAFREGTKFKRGNTQVDVECGYVNMYLHGNLIAQRISGTPYAVQVRLAGWNTPTTRERLNALVAEVADSSWGFSQRSYEPFFNGVSVSDDQWIFLWVCADYVNQWGFDWNTPVPLAQMLESSDSREAQHVY